MLEYSEVEQEAENKTEVGKALGPDWPSKGEVKFEKYAARYRKGLDLVIKNVDVEISSGEKVGIVGRTGAGKSTVRDENIDDFCGKKRYFGLALVER